MATTPSIGQPTRAGEHKDKNKLLKDTGALAVQEFGVQMRATSSDQREEFLESLSPEMMEYARAYVVRAETLGIHAGGRADPAFLEADLLARHMDPYVISTAQSAQESLRSRKSIGVRLDVDGSDWLVGVVACCHYHYFTVQLEDDSYVDIPYTHNRNLQFDAEVATGAAQPPPNATHPANHHPPRTIAHSVSGVLNPPRPFAAGGDDADAAVATHVAADAADNAPAAADAAADASGAPPLRSPVGTSAHACMRACSRRPRYVRTCAQRNRRTCAALTLPPPP